jgi:hypothetical protein
MKIHEHAPPTRSLMKLGLGLKSIQLHGAIIVGAHPFLLCRWGSSIKKKKEIRITKNTSSTPKYLYSLDEQYVFQVAITREDGNSFHISRV